MEDIESHIVLTVYFRLEVTLCSQTISGLSSCGSYSPRLTIQSRSFAVPVRGEMRACRMFEL